MYKKIRTYTYQNRPLFCIFAENRVQNVRPRPTFLGANTPKCSY